MAMNKILHGLWFDGSMLPAKYKLFEKNDLEYVTFACETSIVSRYS